MILRSPNVANAVDQVNKSSAPSDRRVRRTRPPPPEPNHNEPAVPISNKLLACS